MMASKSRNMQQSTVEIDNTYFIIVVLWRILIKKYVEFTRKHEILWRVYQLLGNDSVNTFWQHTRTRQQKDIHC
jgi:hypothetical protein